MKKKVTRDPYSQPVQLNVKRLAIGGPNKICLRPQAPSLRLEVPAGSQTAHFIEKTPVHGPVHSPVHSPQSSP